MMNKKLNQNHLDYWSGRSDEIFRYLDRKDIDFFGELNKVYQEQANEMQKAFYDFVSKYSENGSMSYQEALQRLKGIDLSDYRENARKYREQAEKDPELLKRLNEQYASARATRLDALQIDMFFRAGVARGLIAEKFGSYLQKMAVMSYKKAMSGRVGAINEPALKELVKTPFNGYNYSQQLWGNTDNLVKDLKKVLKTGFVRGDHPRTMARDLAQKYKVANSRAETLVRTDGTMIVNRSAIQRYKDAGLKYYRILVHLDNRTTEICKRIYAEDKRYLIDEMQAGVNAPPFHFNCRSGVIPDEEELNGSVENNSDEVYNLSKKDGTAEYYSERLLDQISKIEPKITSDMQRIAGKNELAGLEFRKKTSESLARKITTDSQIENISLSKAASKINDTLRYTTIFDPDAFEKEYQGMTQRLIEGGYKIVKVKNTWLMNGPYKGVNTVLEKDGINFEMQYHTQESFDLKNGPLHELYEKYRDASTSDQERMKLFKKMLDLNKGLNIPKNIERVK
jgi:SPP1 gp7 family putative phage head morphogenesis protein